MNDSLISMSIDEIRPLIEESRHAFLPANNRPSEMTSQLIEHFQKDPAFQILGYQKNGMAISYIIALSDKTHENSLAIGPMYVGKEERGQGYGKKQVEGFVKLAGEKGYQHVFTKTWGKNQASRAIFEAIGFKKEAVKENDRVNGDSTITYLLKL